ncbi:MAG: hypothetical protein QOH12_2970 [Solirubrobacteraceae bacterium]|jgi:hypothetical protein|nr:hypothetical protein [Solirubrobacteraceae bacterium]
MRDIFKGFMLLRFIGFLALVIVVAVVLGIRSLARGQTAVGAAILAAAVLLAVAVGSLVAHRGGSRPR